MSLTAGLVNALKTSTKTYDPAHPWTVPDNYYALSHFSSSFRDQAPSLPPCPCFPSSRNGLQLNKHKSEVLLHRGPWTLAQVNGTLQSLNYSFDGILGGESDGAL